MPPRRGGVRGWRNPGPGFPAHLASVPGGRGARRGRGHGAPRGRAATCHDAAAGDPTAPGWRGHGDIPVRARVVWSVMVVCVFSR